MTDEGVLFEGLRLGSTQAFTELLHDYDPALRRLALLYGPAEQVGPLLRQTWSTALPGLDMFTWHTTLRAWLTGICVGYGRHAVAARRRDPATTAASSGASDHRPTRPSGAGPGHDDDAGVPWTSLRWSARWGPDGWRVLEDALAAQPLAVREVLWLRDVEGWAWREVLDALGLTGAQGERLLVTGRTALAQVVARHVGAPADGDGTDRERTDAVAALLAALRPTHDQEDDGGAGRGRADLVRVFTAWRRDRGVRPWRRWCWELARRGPSSSPGDAGRAEDGPDPPTT